MDAFSLTFTLDYCTANLLDQIAGTATCKLYRYTLLYRLTWLKTSILDFNYTWTWIKLEALHFSSLFIVFKYFARKSWDQIILGLQNKILHVMHGGVWSDADES